MDVLQLQTKNVSKRVVAWSVTHQRARCHGLIGQQTISFLRKGSMLHACRECGQHVYRKKRNFPWTISFSSAIAWLVSTCSFTDIMSHTIFVNNIFLLRVLGCRIQVCSVWHLLLLCKGRRSSSSTKWSSSGQSIINISFR